MGDDRLYRSNDCLSGSPDAHSYALGAQTLEPT